MVMVFCPCGWKGSAFELAARASGAVQGEDGHLVIYISDNPLLSSPNQGGISENLPDDKMQCPSCGLDFEKMAEWMNENIPIEMIA